MLKQRQIYSTVPDSRVTRELDSADQATQQIGISGVLFFFFFFILLNPKAQSLWHRKQL